MSYQPQLPGDVPRELAAPGRGGSAPTRWQYIDVAPVEAEQEASTGLLEYWRIIARSKGTVLGLAALGALAGTLVAVVQSPIYQGRASIEVQPLNENFMNLRDVSPIAASGSPDADLWTQLNILQSRSMVDRVVAKLKSKPGAQAPGPPVRFAQWRQALGLDASQDREQSIAAAARSLQARALDQTRIIEILCDAPDPQVAAEFANTLVNEFIDQSLESRWAATQRTGDWLTRQLEDLRRKLQKSEDALQAYARESGLVILSEANNVTEQKLRQLQEELSKAQADRVALQSKNEMATNSAPEALPDVLNDAALREYQSKLTDLRRQLAELSSTLTPAHYRVKRVQAQIAELEATLERERGNILKRIRNEYQSARRREELLASAYSQQARIVSDQAGQTVQYNILKREVDTNRQIYDAMLQRVKEAGIASAMRASNIRIVDPAQPARLPYKPNLIVNVALGLMTGLLAGVMLVLVRERTDRSLRAPGDAPTYLNVTELGVIPSADTDPRLRGNQNPRLAAPLRRKKADGADGGGSDGNLEERLELVTWHQKPSLLAESFRATLASILFSGQNGDSPRVIVLTSPGPREGKTTVMTNVGIALAEINRRVLLIDADMRKPRLQLIFDLPNSWGLSDLLREKNPLDQCPLEALARETQIAGLYVLPSGPGTLSIWNLLCSPRMPELLQRVRKEFDTVLIDTAPMLQLPDARVLGRLSDGIILVLRAGHTTRDTAQAARQRFAEDGTPVLGTVLNDWNPENCGYGYYESYYRYYSTRQSA